MIWSPRSRARGRSLATIVVMSVLTSASALGSPATQAKLNFPLDIAIGPDGSLFISDSANSRIRRVDSSGDVSTVAGSGLFDYSGDGGPATKAALGGSTGVAVDSSGALYIADTNNNRIRKVDQTGVIVTVAGDGREGYSGDHGPAVTATLNKPADVHIDDHGRIYIADTGNNAVRRVDVDGSISTIAGAPRRDALIDAGALGVAWEIGDGGPAIRAVLNSPTGVDVTSEGEVIIADSGHNRVRRIATSGIIISIAGSGVPANPYLPLALGDGGRAEHATLNKPRSIVQDGAGNVYIADEHNQRIRRLDDSSGTIATVAGIGLPMYFGDDGPATEAGLWRPSGIAIDKNGIIYVADYRNHRIRRIDLSGTITTVAGTGARGYAGDD
jgi:trimeric autotransporter adhesin